MTGPVCAPSLAGRVFRSTTSSPTSFVLHTSAGRDARFPPPPHQDRRPLVLAVSGALRDALCTAVEHRLAEVGRLWVAERAAEGEVFDPEIVVWILSGLADLARAVREGDENLYRWVA
ncbi:hypothetical protein [Streptomyces sp. NPDC096013]|uniref:hypothetical protein n=1 Tax=Streptomyces sp. NPDC096013 TaxID=3366069 RepID=UPI00382837BA